MAGNFVAKSHDEGDYIYGSRSSVLQTHTSNPESMKWPMPPTHRANPGARQEIPQHTPTFSPATQTFSQLPQRPPGQFKNSVAVITENAKTRSTSWKWIVYSLVVCLLGFVAYSWGSSQLGFKDGPGTDIVITVPEGATVSDVGEILEQDQVIPSATAFNILVKLRYQDLQLQAGSYNMKTQITSQVAISTLQAGPGADGVVVIPEGLWVGEILDSLDSQIPSVDRTGLEAALASQTLPEGFGSNEVVCPELQPLCKWEGILFPATYKFSEDVTAQEVIQELVDSFELVAAELSLVERSAALGYDPYTVLKVASLIESEAAVDGDRAQIAEVIYHRLSGEDPTNSWLGIDATVIYSLGIRNPGDAVIVERHQDSDDPYNTSALGGEATKQALPQTPISATGRASIEAALTPTNLGYKWYTLPDPQTNAHTFSTTKEEHDAADAAHDALVSASS